MLSYVSESFTDNSANQIQVIDILLQSKIVLRFLHNALTKAQSESLEAIQKRAIHITHNLTREMPYFSMLYCANLDSLASRREDLSRDFFHNILDPASRLHSLLPPPRSMAITSRLRSSQTFPKVHTHTHRYCSFIQYALNHYQ